MNFYCITNTINYSPNGSCGFYPPENPWIYNQIPTDQSPVLYVDYKILEGINNNLKNKFGWLCESSPIIENCIKLIKNNIPLLQHSFKKIFTSDESLIKLSPVFDYAYPGSNMPWITQMGLTNKTKLVSMIFSNKRTTEGHQLRHEISQKYTNIDKYGLGVGKHIQKKEEGMIEYMFSFCVENANYDLYFTEKLTDAISCGTIPIYWGSRKIETIFNKNGIIFLEEFEGINTLNRSLYEKMLPFASENLKILKNMKSADTIIQEKIMDILK